MNQPKPKSALPGLLLTALVPAAMAVVISPFMAIPVFIAAFLAAGFLGLPIYIVARRYSCANAFSASLAGGLIGLGASALTLSPLENPDLKASASRVSGDQRFYAVVDGVPTAVVWDSIPFFCGLFVIAGALAGLVFWLYVSSGSRQSSGEGP